MAKLDSGRMSDATKLRAVDNAHNQLEVDLADIIGVPLGQEISASVFGVNPEGGQPIQADGSIRGILSFLLDHSTVNPDDSIGFEFADGTETKRIALVDSKLRIYKKDGADWELIADLTEPGSVKFQSLLDVDIPVGDEFPAPAAAGKFVAVNAVGDKYTHVAAPAGGSTTFAGLTDTPDTIPNDVQMLLTDGVGSLYFEKRPRSVTPWGAWYQCGSTDLHNGEIKILSGITAKSTIAGWDTPSMDGGTYLQIPSPGFYHFWIRMEPSVFQGFHTVWLENVDGYEPIVGPIAVPTYMGGTVEYDGHHPPWTLNTTRWRPHVSGVFSCANYTYVKVNVLYEKVGGTVDDVSAKFEFSIVRVG